MHFDILKEWSKPSSFRTQCVASSFTITAEKLTKRFVGDLPIEGLNWKIGVITGRSGTGKTSIAKNLRYCVQCGNLSFAPDEVSMPLCPFCLEKGVENIVTKCYFNSFEYCRENILEDFPEDLTTPQITKSLCSVGFASSPDWLKPYSHLSQGEKMRVDIARALVRSEKLVVFDEFTSVIDRDIAHIACIAISKSVRKSGRQFIAVTCHKDVVDWLEPDWVLCTDDMNFDKKKEPTRQLSSKSTGYLLASGSCLGNITI